MTEKKFDNLESNQRQLMHTKTLNKHSINKQQLQEGTKESEGGTKTIHGKI